MNGTPQKKTRDAIPEFKFWPGALLLLVLLCLAYQPVWNAGFVWDDPEQLVNNEAVKRADGLSLIWTTVGLSPQYYPLTFSAFWVQHKIWGMNPRGYHVVNVLLMWVVSVLLWRLFRRLGSPVSWWGACLFALHPVNVMSVAWVTELKNVLSGVFIVLAMLAYLPALENRRALSSRRLAAVFGLYMLAMFAKTASSFIPASLLLLHAWKGIRVSRQSWFLVGCMFVFAAVLSVITVRWETMTKFAMTSDFEVNWPQRWVIFGQIFWFYLFKALLPVNLCFFYERWSVPVAPPAYLVLMPLLAIGFLFLLWWKRKSLGRGAWTVMTHYMLTTSALILIHVLFMTRYTWVADHWQFFGLLGLVPALVTGLYGLTSRISPDIRLFHVPAIVLCILFVFGARNESAKYLTLERFYENVLACNPRSWLAYNNLGRYHDERGEKLLAIEYYKKSLAIRPDNFEAVNNFGCALADLGRFAEAEIHFRSVIKMQPLLPGVHNNLGRVLALQGKLPEARSAYMEGLRYKPNDPVTLEGLGVTLARMARFREAADIFNRMLALSPHDQRAHANLGQIYTELGEHKKAKFHFEQSLQYIGHEPDHLNSYAWILGTSKDPEVRDTARAVMIAQNVVDYSPGNPWYWGTLAAAQSEDGHHQDAIHSAEKAMDLAKQQGDQALIKQLSERLNLYRQRMENISADHDKSIPAY